jgi:hypothetical protein
LQREQLKKGRQKPHLQSQQRHRGQENGQLCFAIDVHVNTSLSQDNAGDHRRSSSEQFEIFSSPADQLISMTGKPFGGIVLQEDFRESAIL